MTRGGPRSNKPAAEKALRGNPGKRPINLFEPQPHAPSRVPSAPSWLDALARRHWQEVAPVLLASGVLTDADVDSLALYCSAYSRYRKVLKMVADIDFDSPIFTGWEPKDIAVVMSGLPVRLEKAEASVRLIGSDLGLNPSSRSRLSVNKGKDAPSDPMEDLLGGRRSA
jgi:P27 family predicted phage terminase small subunit